MIFVLDNYDSFTFNLVQYLGELGADPVVVRNDAMPADEARERFSGLLEAASDDVEACYRGDAHFFYTLCGSHPELTRPGFEAARDAYREAGFMPGVVNAEAMIAAFGFELDDTIRLLDAAAETASEVGYEWGVALIRSAG